MRSRQKPNSSCLEVEPLGPEARSLAEHRRQAKEPHLAQKYLCRLNLHTARWAEVTTKTPRSLGIRGAQAALGPAHARGDLLLQARKSPDSAQVLLKPNLTVSKTLLGLPASPASTCPRTAPGRCWPCKPEEKGSSLGYTRFSRCLPGSQSPGPQLPADPPILLPPTLDQLQAGPENLCWSRYLGTSLFSGSFPSHANLRKSFLKSDFTFSCCFQSLFP